MESQCWFYCYPEKLLIDTLHLSTHDFGAYWRALIWYYANGPLPDDDEVQRKIMGVEKTDWARCRGLILHYFSKNGDGLWHNKRADMEITRRNDIIRRNQERTVKARKALEEQRSVTATATDTVTAHLTGAQLVLHREEYNRILLSIKELDQSYDSHLEMRPADKEKHRKLVARRSELRKILGVTV